MKPFRIIDTGLREGRAQMAFDQAMIDLHKAGKIPDTLRFLQFPPTALVGRHQDLSAELRLDACKAAGVGVGRRITGGGALYLDEGQFGWELVFHRDTLGVTNLGDLAKEICEAAAYGLSKLGINARYRPRNDIEVDGRKVSGTGGFFDGSTFFYQGTVLVDMDAEKMVSLLNIPDAKLAKHAALTAAQRIVTLKELLKGKAPSIAEVKQALLEGFAQKLGLNMVPAPLTDAEEQLADKLYHDEIGTNEFVHEIDGLGKRPEILKGSFTGNGGTIFAHLRLEGPLNNRLREVVISGDFFVTPPRKIYDLEAALRGTLTNEIAQTVKTFFANSNVGLLSATPDDFTAALENAIGQSA